MAEKAVSELKDSSQELLEKLGKRQYLMIREETEATRFLYHCFLTLQIRNT